MDFQQGLIATIHDYGLGKLDLPDFRRQLKQRPTSLLIPCLMEEFSRPALGLIREVLAELRSETDSKLLSYRWFSIFNARRPLANACRPMGCHPPPTRPRTAVLI